MAIGLLAIIIMVVVLQEELEREWRKTHTNGTIAEENDDYDDEGETVYPDRQFDYNGFSEDETDAATFHGVYDDMDKRAAVKIQSNYRGYRARKHLSHRQH